MSDLTETQRDQQDVETLIQLLLLEPSNVELYKEMHLSYLMDHCKLSKSPDGGLGSFALGLDSSHPWTLYWLLGSLAILKYDRLSFSPDNDAAIFHESAMKMLRACKDPHTGAFHGGGDGLFPTMPHILTTYAALHCICLLGTKEAYDLIEPKKLEKYLSSLQTPGGGFRVCPEIGECDTRTCYAAVAISILCGLVDISGGNSRSKDINWKATTQFVVSCQNYDGGFGGLDCRESHGGYTYCAVAALLLLLQSNVVPIDESSGEFDAINWSRLSDWLVNRQMALEGGFQGRVNKLVDGCYGYWIGSLLYLLSTSNFTGSSFFAKSIHSFVPSEWNPQALTRYLLKCCQSIPGGGMLDKPTKQPDLYHTCYDLGGLSIAAHAMAPLVQKDSIFSTLAQELEQLHPIFLLPAHSVSKMLEHFTKIKD